MNPDFDQAKQYVLGRLTRELSPHLTYHSLIHTRDDVLPAAERLGRAAGLSDEEQLLLRTAALFHDTGFLIDYRNHEHHSAGLAREKLPGFGYSPEQIEIICGIIGATRMPQSPNGLLQELMCDADLDLLGRRDFMRLNRELLKEVSHFAGKPIRDDQWLRDQARFLREHQFFTTAARSLRAEGKDHNATKIASALASLNGAGSSLNP